MIHPSKIEYIDYGCNPYSGCAHGCRYCYGRGIARKKYPAWIRPAIVENAVELLQGEVPRMAARGAFLNKRIMLCTMTDLYQPIELETRLGREILTLFNEYSVPYDILTKSAHVTRDYDLLVEADGLGRVGFTFAFHSEGKRKKWEPGASPLPERMEALALAADCGIPTWVSVEPIILDETQLDPIVYALAPYVDRWIFGRLAPSMCKKALDGPYVAVREHIQDLMTGLGLEYLIKKELLETHVG